MNIKGRLIGVCIAIVFLWLNTLHFVSIERKITYFDLLLSVLFIFIAFWSGKQYDSTKFYSEKDELTGIYNRRFLTKLWKEKLSKSNQSFLLVIDCDNFKEINDNYGHEKGDQALQIIANVLKQQTRKTDTVSRWGGDEFAVIGECKDKSNVPIIVERLEKEVEKQAKEFNLPLSISIGYSFFPTDGSDVESLFKMADQEMYKNKLNKKNKKALLYS